MQDTNTQQVTAGSWEEFGDDLMDIKLKNQEHGERTQLAHPHHQSVAKVVTALGCQSALNQRTRPSLANAHANKMS